MECEKEFLLNYNIDDYERPSVTTDVAAFMISTEEKTNERKAPDNKLRLLLIKRGGHPFKDKWALPGGFLQKGETVEECAVREIHEETNVIPTALISVGTFSKPGRDPRGWIISNVYASIITEESVKQIGMDDASDAQWFIINFGKKDDDLYYLTLEYDDILLKAVLAREKTKFRRAEFRIIDNGDIAFDHAAVIAESLTVLRQEAKNYDMIFNFLPEKFTLTALQKVQETIMDMPLLSGNFRRMVSSYVEETDEYVKGERYRPAKLYKRKNNI